MSFGPEFTELACCACYRRHLERFFYFFLYPFVGFMYGLAGVAYSANLRLKIYQNRKIGIVIYSFIVLYGLHLLLVNPLANKWNFYALVFYQNHPVIVLLSHICTTKSAQYIKESQNMESQ